MNRFTHIIVLLVVAYWIVAVSIHFGLVFWSPQPTIDRMEAVDSTQVFRTLIDFFEHTPRVNAVIALEAEGGSPTSRLNSDRVRYGIGQLLCLAAMIVDLLLIAGVSRIAARQGVFDEPRVTTKPRPSGSRVTVGSLMISLGGASLVPLVSLYFGGVLLHTRTGKPSDNSLAFIWASHLILVVLIVSVMEIRRQRQRAEPNVRV